MRNYDQFIQSLVFWQRYQAAQERAVVARLLQPSNNGVIPREELKDGHSQRSTS